MKKNNTGIYTITCIVTKSKYLGSAVKLSRREYDHFRLLKKGTHINSKLQNAYNKYGPDNFIFEVIEYVDNKEDLIVREQYYIDTLKPTYNICNIAGSQLGLIRTKETRRKQSEAKRGNKHFMYGKHLSEETISKLSISLKGSKNPFYGKHHTEEYKLKRSKPFKLLSPLDLVFEGINLSRFCREHNLDSSNMYRIMNNKQKSYKGWTKSL